MPHFRARFAAQHIKKLAKLWPVVGMVGLRQSGKTTLMQTLLDAGHTVSFDDLYAREEAIRSPQVFLGKLKPPILLDEVQKAPPIFDAIKMNVDKKRIPGTYFLTGSSTFSQKIGIRESLTGRIGLIELLPLSLAELHTKPFLPIAQLSQPLKTNTPRFKINDIAKAMLTGGIPVPAFLHDQSQRDLYWRSWLETSILRDLARHFPRNFDPDFAFSLLEKMGALLREGELPTLKHFSGSAQKIRAYFSGMENIFILRKISCHPKGIGKETWLLTDAGLAIYLMGTTTGEGVTLSSIRHIIWNEMGVQAEYQGKRFARVYYKSAQGSPVDFILDNIPFRVVANTTALTTQLEWEKRPLQGAMKKLNASIGYLVGPVSQTIPPPKTGGIGILPWSAWS